MLYDKLLSIILSQTNDVIYCVICSYIDICQVWYEQ